MSNKNSKSKSVTTYRCSFCGKSQNQVQRLIAGPGGVYICDECIDLCQEIIEEEQEETQLKELKSLEEWVEEKIEPSSAIIRNVTLPQEYQPIGFSLISYFGRLLQYRYINTPIKCHITRRRGIGCLLGLGNDANELACP